MFGWFDEGLSHNRNQETTREYLLKPMGSGTRWIKEYELDVVLVPLGLLLLVVYHVKLGYRMWKAPTTTMVGLNKVIMQSWVHTTLKVKRKGKKTQKTHTKF